MTQTHSQRAHAKLSPSAAHRWFECPGSIRLSAGIESKSSVFADEGTAAHELAQQCLQSGFDADRYLGEFVNIDGKTPAEKFLPVAVPGKRCFEVTDEMAEAVQIYVDECNNFMGDGWEWEIEAKLDLRHIPGMEFGTGDFTAYHEANKLLAVRDLKYGKGVAVTIRENEQLQIYAVGTAARYHNRGLEKIDLGIVQPRAPLPSDDIPGVRRDVIDAVDLVEFRFRLRDAAVATLEDDAPLKPGDWCKWCPAAVTCPARLARNRDVAEMEFGEPAAVSDLTDERLAEILAEASQYKDWIKRVEERAHARAREAGLPGWKFVRSTSHRKFKDEAAAAKLLLGVLELDEDDVYTAPKLKSPAQVEKVLGAKRKGEIAGLIYKPPGKIILVPEGDPREPVKPDAESEFGD